MQLGCNLDTALMQSIFNLDATQMQCRFNLRKTKLNFDMILAQLQPQLFWAFYALEVAKMSVVVCAVLVKNEYCV